MKPEEIVKCLNCEDTDMIAIKCGHELVINQCKKCGGIWLDRGELEDLKNLGEFYLKNIDDASKPKIEKNRIRECPLCHIVLETTSLPKLENIKIDRCSNCKGLWLDRGDLIKITKS
jgi:Zn-finger nucleic acid-binding protein